MKSIINRYNVYKYYNPPRGGTVHIELDQRNPYYAEFLPAKTPGEKSRIKMDFNIYSRKY